MSKHNVLVLSNPIATPCPTWSTFVNAFSWPVSPFSAPNPPSPRTPSISSETTLVDTPKEHHLRVVSPPRPATGRTDQWHLLDCTSQTLAEASNSSTTLFSGEVHIVLLLINTADYNPRHYKHSARFERDQAFVRDVCSETWLADALVVVCLDDVDAMAVKCRDVGACDDEKLPPRPMTPPLTTLGCCGCCMFPFPPKANSNSGVAGDATPPPPVSGLKGKGNKGPLMTFMDTIIGAFKAVGQECDERDVRAYFLQADKRDVELEEVLERFLDFLKGARYEGRVKAAKKLV